MGRRDGQGLWPGRPGILPDETLASWFARLAEANGLNPGELYQAVLPGAYLYGRDLDRTACPDLLDELAARTGTSPDRLAEATLGRWAGKVYETDGGHGLLTWLPTAGREQGRHSFGQQFCPRCLAGDPEPYFRLGWRPSFVVACPEHRILLADRCPGCSEPIRPLKVVRLLGRLTCDRCGMALDRAEPSPARAIDLETQAMFLRVADTGWATLGGEPLHALAFFRLAMVLLRLLSGSAFALALRYHLADGVGLGDEVGRIPRLRAVHLLNVPRRTQLLRMVGHLLADWPDRFVTSCRAVGISQRHLVNDPGHLPFAFWEPITRLLAEPDPRIEEPELKAAVALLEQRGRDPTLSALRNLLGTKVSARPKFMAPPSPRLPCGDGRYWKLDGISSDVRRSALAAARARGEHVSAWVERALRLQLDALCTEKDGSCNNGENRQASGAVMGVRRIPRSHRSVTGRLAVPGRSSIAFESTLERDFALLCAFDPDVASIEEQPLAIPLPPPAHRYVPDFLVRFHSGRPTELVEVKHDADLAAQAADLAPRFAAAEAFCLEKGWTFRVVTEGAIRIPRLGNARFLLAYRTRAVDPGHCARILNLAGKTGSRSVAGLMGEAFPVPADRTAALPALWHLVAAFRLAAELDEPLTMDSPVWVDGGEHA